MTPTVELQGRAEAAEHCGEGPDADKNKKYAIPEEEVKLL